MMREVIVSRPQQVEAKDADLIQFLNWLAGNREKKVGIYETHLHNEEIILQTTSKDLHIGFGRMAAAYCLPSFAKVLKRYGDEGGESAQFVVSFENDTERDRPLLVTKSLRGGYTVFNLSIVL